MRPQDRTRAILRSKLDAASKLVAIAIADYMSAHDESYPSVATIAANASMTERGVQRVLADALAAGWLTATGANGCRRTFRVGWDQLAAIEAPLRRHPRTTFTPEPRSPPNHVHPRGEPRSPPPPNQVHPRGEPRSPEAYTDEAIREAPTPERARPEQPGQPPPPDPTAVREHPAHREDRPSLTTPRPAPPRPPALDVDPELVAIVGVRGDLLARLLRPGDSSVDPITTLPALLATSLEELRYRPGIGGARAETLRRILADHDLELPRTAEDAERARKEREYDEEMRRDDAERAARDRQRDDNVIQWRNNAAK